MRRVARLAWLVGSAFRLAWLVGGVARLAWLVGGVARLAWLAGSVAWLVGSVGACGGPSLPPAAPFAARGAEVEGVLPLLDGGELELASFRGKPLVLHFFTTWSLPAQLDLDELRAARAALPAASFAILGVGLDVDGYKLIAPWRDAAGIDWLVALPTAAMTAGESVFGDLMAAVPSTVLVDGRGRVAWSHRGPLAAGELERQLARLGVRR